VHREDIFIAVVENVGRGRAGVHVDGGERPHVVSLPIEAR
jgi:hypothetical protein